MKNRLLAILAVGLLSAVNANAASMWITGPAEVSTGDAFELQIMGNFVGEGLIAGGITLNWDDSLVRVDNIMLELPVDDDFSCPGNVNCPPPGPNSAPIVWGSFLADLIDAAAGDTLMATIMLTANDLGVLGAAVFTMQDNPGLSGGWFGGGFTPIDAPSFNAHTTNVVPLPAAAWFFGSALLGLAGVARRKKA